MGAETNKACEWKGGKWNNEVAKLGGTRVRGFELWVNCTEQRGVVKSKHGGNCQGRFVKRRLEEKVKRELYKVELRATAAF